MFTCKQFIFGEIHRWKWSHITQYCVFSLLFEQKNTQPFDRSLSSNIFFPPVHDIVTRKHYFFFFLEEIHQDSRMEKPSMGRKISTNTLLLSIYQAIWRMPCMYFNYVKHSITILSFLWRYQVNMQTQISFLLGLGTASKPNRRLTGGSVRFHPVSIVLNNDNRPKPDVTACQPAVGFWSCPLAPSPDFVTFSSASKTVTYTKGRILADFLSYWDATS